MQPAPKSRYVVFLLVALAGLLTDLATKSWIFGRLGMPGEKRPIWIIDGVFAWETHLNEGALFGVGAGWVVLLVLLSFVAVGGIGVWFVVGGAARDRLLTVCLALVTGGILGNLYDRVGLPGLTWRGEYGGRRIGESVYAVRDWIHVLYYDSAQRETLFDWPIFNIADCLLVCGVGMLVFHAYVLEPRKRKAAEAADAASATSDTIQDAARHSKPAKASA